MKPSSGSAVVMISSGNNCFERVDDKYLRPWTTDSSIDSKIDGIADDLDEILHSSFSFKNGGAKGFSALDRNPLDYIDLQQKIANFHMEKLQSNVMDSDLVDEDFSADIEDEFFETDTDLVPFVEPEESFIVDNQFQLNKPFKSLKSRRQEIMLINSQLQPTIRTVKYLPRLGGVHGANISPAKPCLTKKKEKVIFICTTIFSFLI